MAPVDLLILSPTLSPPPGGVQRVADDMAIALAGRTLRVVGVSTEDSDDPRFRVVVRKPGAVGAALATARFAFVAWSEARKSPVVIQAVTWRAGLPALFVRRRAPMVLFCHGAELTRTKGGALASRLRNVMLRRADALVANSEFTRGLVRSLSGRDATIVHPGIRSLPSLVDKEPSEVLRILSVGRLVANKGHHRMIPIVAQLRAQGVRAELRIVGVGPDRDALEALVRQHDVLDAVTLLGRVDDAAFPDLYAWADVFALLSTPGDGEVEGWGIVFVEAASYALPVVAGRSGGSVESVEDGVTGLVVDTDGDAVAALARFASDPSLRREFGARGRTRAEGFLLESFGERLAAIYDGLAASL